LAFLPDPFITEEPMTHALASIVRALPRDVIDDVMVQSITADMRARLSEKRAQGRGGWQTDECSNRALLALLHKNLAQGDMIDVINLAGMIHLRKQALGESFPPTLAAPASHRAIDVRQPPMMIRIGADGQPAAEGAPHVAVLLPQYGLLFEVTVGKAAENHAEAVAVAEGRLICGQPGRLPEVTELQLLLRRDRHRPAIDTDYFPDTPTDDWYWTATPYSSDPAFAWCVVFSNGLVYDLHRGYSGFVRAVRSVPPSQ